MGSDTATASERAAKVELSLSRHRRGGAHRGLQRSRDRRPVRTPLERQFWGATFGSLTDRFGVDWMVNIWAPDAG